MEKRLSLMPPLSPDNARWTGLDHSNEVKVQLWFKMQVPSSMAAQDSEIVGSIG